MTAVPLSPEQQNVAIKSPEHLIEWLRATDRRYLGFVAEDLVRGQSWPDGIEALMQIIAGYEGHRAAIPTGRTESVKDQHGAVHEVQVCKSQQLEIDELDRAIRWLVAQMVARNPDWSIEQPAL